MLLSNEGREAVDDIGFHMLDETVPLAHRPTPHKAIALNSHVLDGYVGVYDLPGYRLTITRSKSGLLAHISDEPTYPLNAASRRVSSPPISKDKSPSKSIYTTRRPASS